MILFRNIIAGTVIAAFGSPAVSQVSADFDGLYYPTGTTGWTCNPDHIGLHGGALSVFRPVNGTMVGMTMHRIVTAARMPQVHLRRLQR